MTTRERKIYSIKLTSCEWKALEKIAGGNEERLRAWMMHRLHWLSQQSNTQIAINSITCVKEKRVFWVPKPLISSINELTESHNYDLGQLVRNIIIQPELFRHFYPDAPL